METTRKTFTEKAREVLAEAGWDQHKIESMHRKEARKRIQIRHGADRRPFARFRSGLRTGTTPHFRLWMADLKIKPALKAIRLARIAEQHDAARLASSYAMLDEGGFRTMLDLVQADARDLLAVKGIGPKRLEEVKADLATRNVAVQW